MDADDRKYTKPPAKITREAFGYHKKPNGCGSCFYFDAKDSECELFEMLTDQHPNLFNLDEYVGANNGCKAHIAKKK